MRQLAPIIVIFFIVAAVFIIFYAISSPSTDITLKDISPTMAQHKGTTEEPASLETSHFDSLKTDNGVREQFDYYIIVGSFRNLKQAQHAAEELLNDFKTNIIILPQTAEGLYRISNGKYSSLEEAKSKIKSIRTTIRSDAWIFSLKK